MPRKAAGKAAIYEPVTAPAGLYVGTSGWAYTTWKPGFYPEDVPAKRFLNYYASRLTSVEVNYTFNSVLKPGQLEGWLAQVGAGFRFSFKAPQRITHMRRLRECEGLVAEFIESLRPAARTGQLGPILFQLPPNFKVDVARLRGFLGLAVGAATRMAFEFRHASWFTEETYAVLREYDAALCVAESDELQTPEVHTAAGHTCFRLRRNGGYRPKEIAVFAERFQVLSQEREVYAFLKHEEEPTGARNATELLRRLSR